MINRLIIVKNLQIMVAKSKPKEYNHRQEKCMRLFKYVNFRIRVAGKGKLFSAWSVPRKSDDPVPAEVIFRGKYLCKPRRRKGNE